MKAAHDNARPDVVAIDAPRRGPSRRHAPVTADPVKARVPTLHPLRFWKIEEAAANAGISENLLQASDCPRIHIGRALLFDPIETVAWVRLHLSHVVSTDATR